MGGYDFKPRQEAVRVGCHDTISTGTAAHPEQNMYSPFCCRIFREAFNNSSMPTTAGFTGNPYHDILRFSCQLPARIYDVSIIKRIDLFAHNFTKIRWPAIFSHQFSRSMVKICILVRLEITLYIIDENVLSTNL